MPEKATELRGVAEKVLRLDVNDRASIAGLAAQLEGRPIDVLINNAGVASRKTATLADFDEEEFELVFRVNALAPILVVKAVLPNLRAGLREGGRRVIFNITSQLGSIANNTGGSSYGYRASKSALNQLNKSLHNELSPEGFICLAVHPGWVQTDMGGKEAHLTVDQSVTGLVGVLDRAKDSESGKFWNYDGTGLPW